MAIDIKTAKRIDSLYRNMKSMPLLTIIAVFVPILLLFAPLLAMAYLYLRTKLLKELDSGEIVIDRLDDGKFSKQGEPTVSEKIDYIRSHNSRIVMPVVIMVGVALVIAFAIVCTSVTIGH
jgi:hypothetical protein